LHDTMIQFNLNYSSNSMIIETNLIIFSRSKLSLSIVSSALKTACGPFSSAPKLLWFEEQSPACTSHFFSIAASTSQQILQPTTERRRWGQNLERQRREAI